MAITTSLAVRNWPSVCTTIRPRRSFITSTWCVSARPSSQGRPACLIEVCGLAPVPPSCPLISTTSDLPLATPAATVPTPTSATSLTRDPRVAIRVLQIVDQLRQIFDRINVVMRRRRDQAHARRAVANAGDFLVDLVAGQLAAFARLGALGHLDLQLLGADQVFAGDAEAAAGHLLDGAGAAIAVGVGLIADRVFAPFARVALAADAVHGDGQRLVRFSRDRAVRHRAGGKSLDDLVGRLDFVERHRLVGRLEFEQPAQREQLPLLIVDQLAELAELLAAVELRGVLQLGDRRRG